MYDLSNDLRHRNLRFQEIKKYQEKPKTPWNYCLMLSPPLKTKNLIVLRERKTTGKQKLNSSRSAPVHMETRVCLKYFANDWLCKLIVVLTFLNPFKFNLLDNFVRTLIQFYSFTVLNLEQLIRKKGLKFLLLDNYMPNLFTEVHVWYWNHFKFGMGRLQRKVK